LHEKTTTRHRKKKSGNTWLLREGIEKVGVPQHKEAASFLEGVGGAVRRNCKLTPRNGIRGNANQGGPKAKGVFAHSLISTIGGDGAGKTRFFGEGTAGKVKEGRKKTSSFCTREWDSLTPTRERGECGREEKFFQ